MSQRSRDEEVDYVARMVLAVVEAVAEDVNRGRAPSCRRQPVRERIGPSPVYQELERLLGQRPLKAVS
jgi:hypothetical protein